MVEVRGASMAFLLAVSMCARFFSDPRPSSTSPFPLLVCSRISIIDHIFQADRPLSDSDSVSVRVNCILIYHYKNTIFTKMSYISG